MGNPFIIPHNILRDTSTQIHRDSTKKNLLGEIIKSASPWATTIFQKKKDPSVNDHDIGTFFVPAE